ncbi:MAG TPA: PfkB family carbohydrate kinase [Dongiaceae bacterium]|nr:PfkB family carbohydrate kinase [Dongiaceae bacterium]
MAQNSHKVKSLQELGSIAAEARRQGRKVVQCHGVFDVLHLGHVRHLEIGQRAGDMLIVTITGDQYVNKGPGRPVFTEALRAEMLAALDCVDYVGINQASSAEPALEIIRPSVYVKGGEYEDASKDITGKIGAEQEVVERHGGSVLFTHDITFSSSSLINRHFDVLDPELRLFLEKMRDEGAEASIPELIEKVKDYRVVLVGDAIIDEYQYVTPMGKSWKENMIATQFQRSEEFAGGCFAAANHVASFCKSVDLITAVAPSDLSGDLIRKSLLPNVNLHALPLGGRPTTRKIRMVDPGPLRKLFEVYHMDDSPYDPEFRERVDTLVRRKIADADVVIVTDFGHGLIARSTIDILIAGSKFLAVNAQSNSANHGYNPVTRYPKADFICIDAPEARLAVNEKFATPQQMLDELLPARMQCDRAIITWGVQGCYARDGSGHVVHIPAFARSAVDTVGAGDAFFAVAAPLAAAGGTMRDVAFVGNAAGGIKVGIVGHRSSVQKIPVLKYISVLFK